MKIAETRLLSVSKKPDVIMENGRGMLLYDTDSTEYLDFVGGWAVNCLGHSPEVLYKALSHQAARLINCSPAYYNQPLLEYADLLIQNCALDRVFFTSTGAEANEGAIKLARKYGARFKNGAYEIITTKAGFHGRTLATMSATGKEAWDDLYEPKSGGFVKSVFNDLSSVTKRLSDKTCAIMIEPIQGEGGVNIATDDYIRGLREICDTEGVLLIFDEIQTGMGRTGKLFCYEHYDVVPDIMTLAKGIGGGFPLSALLAKEALNIFEPGDQGGTYTGQPLAMTVGLTVLKTLLDDNVVENCRNVGEYLLRRLNDMASEYAIENIRGRGLLIAFDLKFDRGSDIVVKCLADRLLINSPQAKTIRLMPPLIVTERDAEKMLYILTHHLTRNG